MGYGRPTHWHKNSDNSISPDDDAPISVYQRDNTLTPKTAAKVTQAVNDINSVGGGTLVLPKTSASNPLDLSSEPLPYTIKTDGFVVDGYGADHGGSVVDTGSQKLFKTPSNSGYFGVDLKNFWARTNGNAVFEAYNWHGLMQNVQCQGQAGGGVGVDLTACYDATIRRVRSKGYSFNYRTRTNSNGSNTHLKFEDCISSGATGTTSMLFDGGSTASSTIILSGCLVLRNNGSGAKFRGTKYPVITDGTRFESNDHANTGDPHVVFQTDASSNPVKGGRVTNSTFDGHSGSSSTEMTTAIQAYNVVAPSRGESLTIRDNAIHTLTGPAIEVKANASDVSIGDNTYDSVGSIVSDAGTRTRMYEQIGGGVLGGIDLSSISGKEDGDEAVSDGTATSFPAGTIATWDATNTQWVRADGQATV